MIRSEDDDQVDFEFPTHIPEIPTWLSLDTWLVADTHFNHLNVIRYCNRPESWQTDFIQHWQETVQPEDNVLHLGDVIFGRKQDSIDFMRLLPGEKHLILGNHDRGPIAMGDLGFKTVQRSPIIAEFPEHILIFSHYPVIINNLPQSTKRVMNIHGHIHNNPSPYVADENHFNISLEVMAYHLRRLGDLLEEIE